jgi:Dolichyl-phosphate-mannose-protein mannosyltransferase
VSELGGLLLVVAGLGALGATGAFAACALRLRSPIAFLLAAYLVAWIWVVTVAFVLSPARWLTRGSLLAGLVLGLLLAAAAWLAAGRPAPPPLRPAFRGAAGSLRDPAILVLAIAVALGAVYVAALAFFTPSNDPDSLAYHLARAALWRQQQGVAHVEHVEDERVNFFPPNAEIGQLATMLLASSDRYAALPQLLAYGALALCVAGLARRIRLETREAVFAALAFATLPLVALQASGTLNDLVVASFLAAAAYFALQDGRASLLLLAVAVALAVGTKYTTLVALPMLALVAALAHPPRRWPALALAGVAGCAAGSIWYLVNVVEEGRPDADLTGQRADLSPVPVAVVTLRLLISLVELPGAAWPRSLAFLAAAGVLAVAGVLVARRSRLGGRSLLVAAGVTAAVLALPLLWELVVRAPFKLALVLGPDGLVDRFAWTFNTRAEPIVAWYGPLGLLLLAVGAVVAVAAWRRGRLPALAVAFAAAPLVLIATLALVLSWDTARGRFILFGIVLAAATWGALLRFRAVALAAAAIGSTALFLALAEYETKPSGLFGGQSIWGEPRWRAQTTVAGYGLNADVLAFVDERVPDDASLGLALVGWQWISPYFGERLTRHVAMVSARGGSPPADAGWLVLSPGADVRRCPESWRAEHVNGNGWRVERRLRPDGCLEAAS